MDQNYLGNSNLMKSGVTNYTFTPPFENPESKSMVSSHLSQLQLTTHKVKDLKSENRELKKELHRMKKIQAGWAMNRNNDSNMAEFQIRMNELMRENEMLRNQSVAIQNQNDILLNDKQELERKISIVSSQKTKVEESYRSLNTKNSNFRNNPDFQKEINDMERKYQSKLRRLQSEVTTLRNEDNLKQSEIQKFRQDNYKLKSQMSNVETNKM